MTTDNKEPSVNSLVNRIRESEDQFSQTIDQINNRIKDVQLYPTIIIACLTAFIIGLGLFFAFNLQSEKNRLRDIEDDMVTKIDLARKELRDEIKSSFEGSIKKPNIILLASIDIPLEGQTIVAQKIPTTNPDFKVRIRIPLIFKNNGEGTSEPIFTKLYSTKILTLNSKSTDEEDFAYEMIFSPEKWPFQPAIIPAGVSAKLNAESNVNYNDQLDIFPMMVKVYYGGDSFYSAKFFISLKDNIN